ncbi:MAG TPA: hypothetical protein VI408_05625 [Gaiellaceae bacterium]
MNRYRFALQTVVAKEAKAYGFTVVVWCAGAFLLVERGKPTAAAILVFVGAILFAQAVGVLFAFGKPTRTWHMPEQREYVWSTFHVVPVAVGVLLGWLLAAVLAGMWAYALAPCASVTVYQLLLGVESLLFSAEDQISSVTEEMSLDTSE